MIGTIQFQDYQTCQSIQADWKEYPKAIAILLL